MAVRLRATDEHTGRVTVLDNDGVFMPDVQDAGDDPTTRTNASRRACRA